MRRPNLMTFRFLPVLCLLKPDLSRLKTVLLLFIPGLVFGTADPIQSLRSLRPPIPKTGIYAEGPAWIHESRGPHHRRSTPTRLLNHTRRRLPRRREWAQDREPIGRLQDPPIHHSYTSRSCQCLRKSHSHLNCLCRKFPYLRIRSR